MAAPSSPSNDRLRVLNPINIARRVHATTKASVARGNPLANSSRVFVRAVVEIFGRNPPSSAPSPLITRKRIRGPQRLFHVVAPPEISPEIPPSPPPNEFNVIPTPGNRLARVQ